MRNTRIDTTKGFLILLVIVGHILYGGLSENIFRYFIYFFHMPLFIGISGYLFKIKPVESLTTFSKKYHIRVIKPWIIAVITFIFILNGNVFTLENKQFILIYSFITPYFHLWFIPGFLSWIFITWFLHKIRLDYKYIFIFSLITSLFFYFVNNNLNLFIEIKYIGRILEITSYTFRPQFFVFFIIGYLLNKDLFTIKVNTMLKTTIILAILIPFSFYLKSNLFSGILFFLFNSSLIILTISLFKIQNKFNSKILVWIGQNSLAIYLWHVIPILISNSFFEEQPNNTINYLTSFSLEAFFLVIIYYLSRLKFVNKHLFGIQ